MNEERYVVGASPIPDLLASCVVGYEPHHGAVAPETKRVTVQ